MKRLLAALVIIGYATASQGQQVPTRNRLVDRFAACFFRSTQSQFFVNIAAEPNEVAERAFFACSTEEQAIYANFELAGLSPDVARAVVLRIRTTLKRKIVG